MNAIKQLRKPLNLSKLPAWKARVEIAKDVIAAVKLDKVRVKARNGYVIFPTIIQKSGVELREIIASQRCQVCVLGACLVAVVARDNDFRVPDGDSGVGYRFLLARLMPFFAIDQMNLIEAAFECDGDFWSGYETQDATERLLRIMQNIIDNRGTFTL